MSHEYPFNFFCGVCEYSCKTPIRLDECPECHAYGFALKHDGGDEEMTMKYRMYFDQIQSYSNILAKPRMWANVVEEEPVTQGIFTITEDEDLT